MTAALQARNKGLAAGLLSTPNDPQQVIEGLAGSFEDFTTAMKALTPDSSASRDHARLVQSAVDLAATLRRSTTQDKSFSDTDLAAIADTSAKLSAECRALEADSRRAGSSVDLGCDALLVGVKSP